MKLLFFFVLTTIYTYAEESKTVDVGSISIESTVRQPPIQVTENPNQISITAKEILTEDFFEFENNILKSLKTKK